MPIKNLKEEARRLCSRTKLITKRKCRRPTSEWIFLPSVPASTTRPRSRNSKRWTSSCSSTKCWRLCSQRRTDLYFKYLSSSEWKWGVEVMCRKIYNSEQITLFHLNTYLRFCVLSLLALTCRRVPASFSLHGPCSYHVHGHDPDWEVGLFRPSDRQPELVAARWRGCGWSDQLKGSCRQPRWRLWERWFLLPQVPKRRPQRGQRLSRWGRRHPTICRILHPGCASILICWARRWSPYRSSQRAVWEWSRVPLRSRWRPVGSYLWWS